MGYSFFWFGGGVTFYLLRRPLRDLTAGVFQAHGSSLKFTAIVLKQTNTNPHCFQLLLTWEDGLELGPAVWMRLFFCGRGVDEELWFGFSTGAGPDPTLTQNTSPVPLYASP